MTNDEETPAQDDTDQKSDEEAFVDGAQVIAEALEDRPEAFRELLDLVGRRVAGPIDERTWGRLDISLIDYLGDQEAASVLEWGLAADPGDLSRIEEFERIGNPAVAELIRRLVAMYGLELRDANGMRDFPHNWRTMTHRVYQSVALGTTFIELTVDKQNGETVVLDGPADSILSFVQFVSGALRVAGRDAFSADIVDDFDADIESLLREWREAEEPRLPDDFAESEA